jgi:LacI family transcriptional regulator
MVRVRHPRRALPLQDEYLLRDARTCAQARSCCSVRWHSPRLAESAHAAGEPLVFVNRRCARRSGSAPFVGIDNRRGGTEVADRLAALGAVHDLAAIHGQAHLPRRRPIGLRRLCRARGAHAASRVAEDAGRERYRDAEHLRDRLRRHGRAAAGAHAATPRGLFCASDLIAFGAHRRAPGGRARRCQTTICRGRFR